MKICFFLYSMSSGGAERVTALLSDYWVANGWSVTVVTIAGRAQDFYTLDARVQRIGLGLDRQSIGHSTPLISNARRIAAIRRILLRQRPCVAVGIMSTANCLLGLAVTGTGVPAIGSEHFYPPLLPMNRVWSLMRRFTYGRLDAVTALTRESAEWIQTHTNARRAPVIQNAVRLPINTQRASAPVDVFPGQRILITAGRLVPQKGYDRLLPVFADLASDFTDWNLVILGDGPCLTELQNLAADLGIASRVLFAGAVDNIDDWYAAADIYVMSSRAEGFPNTLLEALAHGLPAVSVDCDTGPRDILRDNIDGLLVPQADQQALAAALSKLMRDARLRRQFACRAIEARQRFSIEKIAAAWERLFSQLKAGDDRGARARI